jgi:GLPGLI family protein
MRYVYFTIFLFSFYFTKCQNQKLELTYIFNVVDFSKSLDINNQYKSYFSEKIKNYNLLSNYLSIEVISNKTDYIVKFDDILGTDNFTNSEITALKSLILPFSPIYIKENQIYAQNNLVENVLISFTEDKILKWKITSERKKILNYDCYKAIPIEVNDSFKNNLSLVPEEIWFSPELNFKASPSLFSNVPGVILEMKYKNFNLKVHKVTFSNKNLEYINMESFKLISYAEFENLIQRNN